MLLGKAFFSEMLLADDLHLYSNDVNNTYTTSVFSEQDSWTRALADLKYFSWLQQMPKSCDYIFSELKKTNQLIMPELNKPALIITKKAL